MSMIHKSKNSVKSDERGLVAIIVTVIVILLMMLTVLAMSQLANREQRQTLDRQLSDQAYYNAESGINDVSNYLFSTSQALIDNSSTPCRIPGSPPSVPSLSSVVGSSDIDGATGTNKYTCVNYNKAPNEVIFQQLPTSSVKVMPVSALSSTGSPVNVERLVIAWDDAQNPSAVVDATCHSATSTSRLPQSCNYGGLRTEIFSASTTRDIIANSAFSQYLLPANSGGIPSTTISGKAFPDTQGIITPVTCNGPASSRRCTTEVADINRNNFFLNLRSLYRPTNVTVKAFSGATQLRLKDAQINIDVTGRANDILRRVEVRIPAGNQYDLPGFALQSKEAICKVYDVNKDGGGNGTVTSSDPALCPIN